MTGSRNPLEGSHCVKSRRAIPSGDAVQPIRKLNTDP